MKILVFHFSLLAFLCCGLTLLSEEQMKRLKTPFLGADIPEAQEKSLSPLFKAVLAGDEKLVSKFLED